MVDTLVPQKAIRAHTVRRTPDQEFAAIARGQKWLNLAWGGGGAGMLITVFAMSMGSPTWPMPLVILCGSVAAAGLMGAPLAYLSDDDKTDYSHFTN
jgi:hypothetical protein